MKTTPTSDTIKILLPSEAIEPGFDCFTSRTSNKQARSIPGLQSIRREQRDHEAAVIEISSKILPGPELIHMQNINQVFEKINQSGRIAIRPNAIEHACCLSIDPATDIVVPGSKELLEIIYVMAYHPHYQKNPHRRSQNTTFYYNKSKSGKYAGKAKVYDKHAEDGKGGYAPNTIRFEMSCPNSLAIQHSFGVNLRQGRILLKDVLGSAKNPVADKFEEIFESLYVDVPQNSMMMGVEHRAFGANKEEIFLRQLASVKGARARKKLLCFNTLRSQAYDLERIYALIKPTYTSRVGKKATLKPFADLLASFQAFNEELTVDFQVLMAMRELLRNPGAEQVQQFAVAA